MSDEEIVLVRKESEAPPRRKPKKIKIPRRSPSIVIPSRQIIYITADKTTCAECPCFSNEEPYIKPKKLRPCQRSPRTLYEITAEVVDGLSFPSALEWSEEDVAEWMEDVVGLPQYRNCILDNHIDGMRLLMFEDPSKLPEINIHYFKHIQMITSKVAQEYTTDFVRFARSIALPHRRPLVNCVWFKSRTGPSWGIRKNWTRSDILRWMKIIMPEPIYLDHWDLVWYQKPDFPKMMFARLPMLEKWTDIPQYKPTYQRVYEYQLPRKFKVRKAEGDPSERDMIWMQHRPGSICQMIAKEKEEEAEVARKKKIALNLLAIKIEKESRLVPKKVTTEGLNGKDLILARRKMPKPKFFP